MLDAYTSKPSNSTYGVGCIVSGSARLCDTVHCHSRLAVLVHAMNTGLRCVCVVWCAIWFLHPQEGMHALALDRLCRPTNKANDVCDPAVQYMPGLCVYTDRTGPIAAGG